MIVRDARRRKETNLPPWKFLSPDKNVLVEGRDLEYYSLPR